LHCREPAAGFQVEHAGILPLAADPQRVLDPDKQS
jgi:hypothetical protein